MPPEDHVRACVGTLREGVDYLSTTEDGTLRDDVLARCCRLELKAGSGEGFGSFTEYEEVWAPELEEDDGDLDWIYPRDAHDPAAVAALASVHACLRRLFWARYEAVLPVEGGYHLVERQPAEVG